ncbi:hypothetical protein ACHWQZ_G018327 [Mnemiopsis leidyi]
MVSSSSHFQLLFQDIVLRQAGVPMMIAFVYTVVPFLICRGESCLGNTERVQIPNTMADLNEQLQGLQNQLNSHFQDRQSVTSTDSEDKKETGGQELREELRPVSSCEGSSTISFDNTSDFYYSGSELGRGGDEEEEEEEEDKIVISHTTVV